MGKPASEALSAPARRRLAALACGLVAAAAAWHAPRALGSVYEVVGRVQSSFVEQKDVSKARVKHPAVLAAILQELRQPHSPESLLSRLRVEVGGGDVRIRYRTTDPAQGQPLVEALCREVEFAHRVSLWQQRDEFLVVRRDLLQPPVVEASEAPPPAAMEAVPALPRLPPAARRRWFWFMKRPPQPAAETAVVVVPSPGGPLSGRAAVSEAVQQEVAAIDAYLAGMFVEVLGVEVHPASPWPVPWRRLAMACLLGALGSLCGLAILGWAARRMPSGPLRLRSVRAKMRAMCWWGAP